MHRMTHWLTRHAAALFFPAALILYDFSAYLTTDLIQPGILHVVRDFNADVALAPASVSLYMAGGMALQWLLGPLSDRIGRRPVLLTGALIFTLACLATLFTTSMTQFLIARFVQGTSICFIATVGYVTVQEAFEEKRSIRLMAVITSVVLVAPIVGPLSGAALMHFIHWKALFGIIAAMGPSCSNPTSAPPINVGGSRSSRSARSTDAANCCCWIRSAAKSIWLISYW